MQHQVNAAVMMMMMMVVVMMVLVLVEALGGVEHSWWQSGRDAGALCVCVVELCVFGSCIGVAGSRYMFQTSTFAQLP